MDSTQPNVTSDSLGSTELHWWSGRSESAQGDQLRMCVIVTPAKSTSSEEKFFWSWLEFTEWLRNTIRHRVTQMTNLNDTEALKKFFIRSVEDTGLKVIAEDRVKVDLYSPQTTEWPDLTRAQIYLPSGGIQMQVWHDQTNFHQSMLSKSSLLVGILSDGSLVTKGCRSRKLFRFDPHTHADVECLWCKEDRAEAESENWNAENWNAED